MVFKDFINNLTKNQKIGLLVLLQIIFIVMLMSIYQLLTNKAPNVELKSENSEQINIPNIPKNFIEENIWGFLVAKNIVKNSDNIDDATIRESSLEEVDGEDKVMIQAKLLVDIDSLKQTFIVNTGWSKDGSYVGEVTISCPPQKLMKYPETICYGMYNNTYSLDLYLPYMVYPDNADETEEPLAPNIYIGGNEYTKTIHIMVSVCNADEFKAQAMDYLKTTPIKLDEYKIEYEINTVNAGC